MIRKYVTILFNLIQHLSIHFEAFAAGYGYGYKGWEAIYQPSSDWGVSQGTSLRMNVNQELAAVVAATAK